MIELVRDLRVINVLAKFENDPWKIMDVRVVTGLVCPAARPFGRRQYPGALKGCGVKMTRVGYRSDYELTQNTPYLAVMGEPWSAFCKYSTNNVCAIKSFNCMWLYWIIHWPLHIYLFFRLGLYAWTCSDTLLSAICSQFMASPCSLARWSGDISGGSWQWHSTSVT